MPADSGVQLTIAGITLCLQGFPTSQDRIPFDVSYRLFTTSPESSIDGDDRLVLRWHGGGLPDMHSAQVLFDSDASWSAAHWRGRFALLQHDPRRGRQPYQITLIDPDWQHGDLYARTDLLSRLGCYYNPLNYPLDEVLMIHLLSRGHGVLFHAYGLDDNGEGILFVGVSGAGKSTMARLWQQDLPGVTILSDDRVVVRRKGMDFWAYGTPWSGEMGIASNCGVPLRRILLIEHGVENRLHELTASQAVAQIMCCVFPTFWDHEGMIFTLDFLMGLVDAVPCHRLQFVPDPGIVDFVHQIPIRA